MNRLNMSLRGNGMDELFKAIDARIGEVEKLISEARAKLAEMG